MKLYEIANDYLALLQAIDEGEIPEEAIADTLEAIEGEIEYKADNLACVLKTLEAEAAAIKAEEKALAERRKQKENASERIKNYLSDVLQRLNINKLETARNKITFRKSESVVIGDSFIKWAQDNRADLLKFTDPTADKTAIKQALKEGAEIEGAYIESKQNIQIK